MKFEEAAVAARASLISVQGNGGGVERTSSISPRTAQISSRGLWTKGADGNAAATNADWPGRNRHQRGTMPSLLAARGKRPNVL